MTTIYKMGETSVEVPRDRYAIRIKFRGQVYGGTPNTEKMIEGMLGARMKKWQEKISKGKATPPPEGSVEAATLAQIEAVKGQVNLEEEKEKSINVFKRDGVGLYMEPRQVRACVREAVLGLGITKRLPYGSKDDVAEYMNVKPSGWRQGLDEERIYFERAGDFVKDCDGIDEQPIQAMTPQGPRSAISVHEYLRDVEVEFEVWFLATRESRPNQEEFLQALMVMQELGLGATRSQYKGHFDVLEVRVLEQHPIKPRDASKEAAPKPKKAKKTAKSKSDLDDDDVTIDK